MPNVTCPSCGAPLEMKTRSSLILVCSFCNSTLMRQNMDLSLVGKMAELQEDGSPIQIGVTGTFSGVGFEVVGRLQLEYPAGFWNEWYLEFHDGRNGWLGDGQGQYTVTFLVESPPLLPPFEKLRTGYSVSIRYEEFEVTEVSRARCIAGAGELPFEVKTGYDLPVADLAGCGTRFATIDYSEKPPLVFTGNRLEFDELKLRGLREFEGW
jgi:hypothetical protein